MKTEMKRTQHPKLHSDPFWLSAHSKWCWINKRRVFQYASPPTAPKRCNDQSLPTHSATLLPCSRVIAVVFSSNHSQPIGPRFWGYG